MRFFTSIFLLFLIPLYSVGQDIHFTQFNTTPFNNNPALIGLFNADYRIGANYRSQWSSVTVPFSTFNLSGEAKRISAKVPVAAGAAFTHDIAGDSRFRTMQLIPTLSYPLYLTHDSTRVISGGLQTGFSYRIIDYSNLNFDSQYNGIRYDASTPTGEIFNTQKYLNLSLGAGITYRQVFNKSSFTTGISLYNINKSKQSFFDNTTIRLDRRVNLLATADLKLNESISLQPWLLFSSQGKYKEVVTGGYVRKKLNAPGNKGIYAGGFLRPRDAFALSVAFDYDDIYAGVSYDINFSNLTPASRHRGAIEFSVIYLLRKYVPAPTQLKTCPAFI